MRNAARRTGASRVMAAITACIAATLAACFLQGCDTKGNGGGPAAIQSSPEELRRRSEAMLRNAMLLLADQRAGGQSKRRLTQAERESVDNRLRGNLNQWLREAAIAEKLRLDESNRRVLDRLVERRELPPSQREIVVAETFSPADARHVNDCMLLAEMARHAKGSEPDDLSQARALFDWVVRNIQLVPDEDEDHASLQQYAGPVFNNALLIGKGTAIERAWLFVLLLRQLRLQSCFVGAPTAKYGIEPRWVAVLIQNDLYLFDPRAGLPVPGVDDRAMATVQQLAACPDAVIGRIASAAEADDVPTAQDMPGISLRIDANPISWSPRMRVLESEITGMTDPVVLYEELGVPDRTSGEQDGSGRDLLSRIAEAAGPLEQPLFAAEPIGVLHVPTLLLASSPPPSQQRRARPPILEPFFFGDGFLGNARDLQLRGLWSEAIKRYQEVFSIHSGMLANPDRFEPRDKYFVKLSQQMATSWVGLCMYEQGNFQLAADTWLGSYDARFPDSRWADGARYVLARSLEAQADTLNADDLNAIALRRKAAELYRQTTSPQRHGDLLRARRLEKLLP